MRFTIEVAKRGQAVCKFGKCKQKIEKGSVRIGKISPSPFAEGAEMTQWFHAACLFEQMKNPRATKLEAVEDLEGLDELQDSDQQLIQDLFQKLGEEPSASATPYKKKKAGDAGADLDEETPKSKKQKKGDAKEAANKPQKGKKVAAASDHSDEEKTPKAKASKKSVGGRKKKVTDKADD